MYNALVLIFDLKSNIDNTLIIDNSYHQSFRKLSKKHKVMEDPVRMPPVVDFTTETSREMEWDNIGKEMRLTKALQCIINLKQMSDAPID